jgi:hypothetical protein
MPFAILLKSSIMIGTATLEIPESIRTLKDDNIDRTVSQ